MEKDREKREAEQEKKFKETLKKAERGDIDAQYELGSMYEYIKQNYKKALEWYLKAANSNHAKAQEKLGDIYAFSSPFGVKKDYKKAFEWFEKASAQNHAGAIDKLGLMYERGWGVRQNYKKALEYYERALEKSFGTPFKEGSDEILLTLLYLLELGAKFEEGEIGGKPDYYLAFRCYEIGAKYDSYCMLNLARMYENGIGTKVNMKKALEFYRKASAGGNEQAKKALARLKAPEDKSASVATKTQKQTSVPSSNNRRSILMDNALIRPRVAVIAFDDKSEEGNAPASAIMNMMISELHKTGAFELLEREHLDVVMNERKLLNLSDTSTATKLGRIAGAQYIITGAITLYYYNEKGSGFLLPILGAASQAKTAYVVIDARIIDVETGKIVYASDQTGDATNKAKTSIANYNKMVGGLLGMATRNAVEKHVSAMKSLTLEI